MRRGTRVGQAYIAVTADGDGINEEIVDSVESAGPGVEKAGEEHGEAYGDNFSEGFFARMRRKFGPQLDKEFSERMGEAGGDAGDKAGLSFVDSLRARLDTENDRVSDLIDRILGDNGRSDKRMGRLTTALASSERAAERLNSELSETLRIEERLARAAKNVSGNGDRRGDDIGKLFGAGSRNNALNAFGRVIGGIVNMTDTLFRSLSKFPSLLSQFSAGFSSAAEGASMFEKIGAGFGKEGIAIGEALAATSAAGPAAAAAVLAVAVAMTLLVSVANALLAVLTALAATILSALVGALAVAAAGVTVLAGAAGLAVLAFMSMTDAQKALLKGAFEPLHQVAIGLGQTMLQDLIPAFATWSENLQVALAAAYPLAQIMGGALAQAGNILTAALSGPGFALFISSLTAVVNGTSTLQGIITNLSSALGGFLNGLLGMFAAIVPYVLQFSDYLNRVATRFSEWATSAQGQNAITDFVGRALTSLQSLWNFIGALGGLISAVLFSPEGQNAGNNIFDDMADAVRRFTDYISKEDRLEKWFQQGLVFAEALGRALVIIGQVLQSLNQSGVIDGIARLVDIGAGIYQWFSQLPDVIQGLIFPLKGLSDAIGALGGVLDAVTGGTASASSSGSSSGGGSFFDFDGILDAAQQAVQNAVNGQGASSSFEDLLAQLQASGAAALSATSTDSGGYVPPVDPNALSAAQMAAYEAMANAIIKNGPTYAAMIKKALNNTHKTIKNAITSSNADFSSTLRDLATAGSAADVTSAIKDLVEAQSATIKNTITTLNTNAANLVSTAQDAVNSAAESLKNATTKSAANSALAALAIAQDQLAQAEAAQTKINNRTKKLKAMIAAANAIVSAQGVLNQANANALAQGFSVVNATLADYADARAQVAVKLEAANGRLQEAVALRDNFKAAITDAVNAFAALTTAQAKTINGVEQALTATDITDNLQSRLDKIKTFQSNLNILLSQGLSQAAYKQLLDAGVEQGGAFAQALVNGGQGAVQQTNSLTAQIAQVAEQLGLQASDRMYQAGVDAAQGLVDGLTSLSTELNSAATALGTAIAAAIAKALGIHSPSTVLYDQMYNGVGDGAVGGMDAATRDKIGPAARRMSDAIAVSPEVASYAAQRGDTSGGRVSGNSGDPRIRDLIIQTPTENPKAVAVEVLNEITGRL